MAFECHFYIQKLHLETSSQFRPPPPPYWGSEQLNSEIEEVVQLQSNLTIEENDEMLDSKEGIVKKGKKRPKVF